MSGTATANYRCVARAPHGDAARTEFVTDRDVLAGVAHDAAFVQGSASALVTPHDETGVAAALRGAAHVLPVGAQSSLTGGATPMGEAVLSLARFTRIDLLENGVRVGAGVHLRDLQAALAGANRYFPPVPAYDGAQVGGAVSTNAAGPATFKYGAVRGWVQAITVVLAGGDVLDLERGQCLASLDGHFEVVTSRGTLHVPVPTYVMPNVAKCSAGYFAQPGMDLLDLFVGAEGTLGVITEVTLRTVTPAPKVAAAFVPCRSEAQAFALTRALREEAFLARAGDELGLDVSAVEYLDARSLDLVREDGADRRVHVALPPGARALLLVQFELQDEHAARMNDDLANALLGEADDGPVTRLVRLLVRFDLVDHAEIAPPDDACRRMALLALREAVPDGVNTRVCRAQLEGRGVAKVGVDMIVPFERLEEATNAYRSAFESRGLDHAIWGHLSDGNLHPNVLARTPGEVEAARDAVLVLGKVIMALGGCPLAEHGVGRNLTKQELLRRMYGDAAIHQMRLVKRALDPDGKLAPGNVFTQT